ncbi:hypothetical protein LEAN103870_19675 [Legionella anisa]|uniref:Uncharacterized protein n=1 Tax=Legionella anisa TaxID=28082 RepID=A0AAX0WTT9_9GAMM|nr:hypothetical protein [Legionella anisa]AWN74645.1 hypothetical protein DLD14_12795 [Legionella anisa]KTC74336.1 hypothetical protein Lani_0782 [Legionella anisa]MCW8425238.1 hypothetical protein [Legionella anisa]MCW8449332.1 hypothetical protein [Legionella anisa]PNL61460.1 hypothetical protein A6J39_009680 [Legionella anisa]
MARYNLGKSMASRFVSHAYHYYPEDFHQVNFDDLTQKYDPLIAGIYYEHSVYHSNDNSLQVPIKDLENIHFQDPEQSILLRKYYASYLYFSIYSDIGLSFLKEDEEKLQKTVDMALDSPEIQKVFLELCSDTDFIKKDGFLHMMEHLYICCPYLIPKDIYEEKDFLEFKEKAYQKLEESINTLENVVKHDHYKFSFAGVNRMLILINTLNDHIIFTNRISWIEYRRELLYHQL